MAEHDATSLTEILLGSNTNRAMPTLDLTDDPQLTIYLTELPNSPLPLLLSTPQSLSSQSHTLTSSLTSLTHTSYPTFLSLHTTTNSLRSSLSSLSTSLDTLIDESLPALENAAKEFKETSGPEVLSERTKARVVLEQHDKLRDLLDVPVLIDTCVRNGMYAEALSLASHASSSLASCSPSAASDSLPLAASLNASISHSLRTMLSILLSTLREPGPGRKLPALWKAVNFIRRMDVVEEEELALAFLSGRGDCLHTALGGLGREHGIVNISQEGKGKMGKDGRDAEDVARFLRKYIDTWREGVYDIITQYTAIFLERTSTSTSSPSKPTPSTTTPPILLRTLLTTYASHALTALLLPTLHLHLPHSTTALPSLLTQLTYCATAFARVGLDFRGVLEGMFGEAVREIVIREMREAGSKWSQGLLPLLQPAAATANRPHKNNLEKWLKHSKIDINSPPPPPATSSLDVPAHIPPPILASYPPIAEYTNALLTTFNGLRLLAPVKIMRDLVAALDAVLGESVKVLFLACAGGGEGGSEGDGGSGKEHGAKAKEEEVMRAAGTVFVSVFVPFVRRALVEGVYGVKMMEVEGHGDGKTRKWGVGVESELGRAVRDWEAWLTVVGDIKTDT